MLHKLANKKTHIDRTFYRPQQTLLKDGLKTKHHFIMNILSFLYHILCLMLSFNKCFRVKKYRVMLKKIHHHYIIWTTLLGTMNVGLFLFLICILRSDRFINKPHYDLDPISIQFSIMNIMLICVSIFLVVASLVGYNGIKAHAEDIAQKIAREIAKEEMIEFFAKVNHDERQYSPTPSTSITKNSLDTQKLEKTEL